MKTLVITLLLAVLLVSASNVMAGGYYAQYPQRSQEVQAEQKRLDDHLAKIEAEAAKAFGDVTTPIGSQTCPQRPVGPDSRLCVVCAVQ